MTANELKIILLNTNWFEDNLYLDKYIEIILANLDTLKNKTNYHHIIPVSCWKLMNKKVDDTFGVNLLPSDHAIAHHLLGLCTIGEFRYKMQSCFIRMSENKRFVENLDYENLIALDTLKVEFSNEMSKRMTGNKLSDEQCKQISKRSKEMWADPDFKASMKLKMKMAADSMTDEQRALKGKRISESKKGTKCFFNSEESIKKGLATKKANGTLARSEETKTKISNALMGHSVSDDTKQKISEKCKGIIPPNAKPVICLETNEEYQSARDAEIKLNLPKASVWRCCRGKQKQVNGLHWKYKNN